MVLPLFKGVGQAFLEGPAPSSYLGSLIPKPHHRYATSSLKKAIRGLGSLLHHWNACQTWISFFFFSYVVMVMHVCNPRTSKAETGRFLGSMNNQPTISPGQWETLSPKQKERWLLRLTYGLDTHTQTHTHPSPSKDNPIHKHLLNIFVKPLCHVLEVGRWIPDTIPAPKYLYYLLLLKISHSLL